MSGERTRMTPVDDDYATCAKTLAELRVYSGVKPFGHVSRVLDLEPTDYSIQGRRLTNSRGRERVQALNAWFLSSEQHVASRDTRRHLDWLLQKLLPKASELAALQSEDGIRMTVYCLWWSSTGEGGPTLWPEQMHVLASLNLECGFSFAFYGEGSDQGESTV